MYGNRGSVRPQRLSLVLNGSRSVLWEVGEEEAGMDVGGHQDARWNSVESWHVWTSPCAKCRGANRFIHSCLLEVRPCVCVCVCVCV